MTHDNSGYFRQEIYYPGLTAGNSIVQQPHAHNVFVQQPVASIIPRVNIPISSTEAPLEEKPIVVENIPSKPVDITTVRSILNRQRLTNIAPIPLPPAPLTTTFKPRTTTEPTTLEELEEQAKSAHYKFGTSVHDTINDHEHVRQEVREGLALKGMYSYSDGFFRRTVYYEADEGGYRVVKEDIEPVGDGEGPKFNPDGKAAVKSTLTGNYDITVDDFWLNKKQEQLIEKRGKPSA